MTSILILENQEPGDCATCPLFYWNAGVCSWTMRFDGDCPLIEIVTCRECMYWHEGEWYNTCDKHIGHGFMAEHFCSDGERKNDDHI